jgi:hypothetical protein
MSLRMEKVMLLMSRKQKGWMRTRFIYCWPRGRLADDLLPVAVPSGPNLGIPQSIVGPNFGRILVSLAAYAMGPRFGNTAQHRLGETRGNSLLFRPR